MLERTAEGYLLFSQPVGKEDLLEMITRIDEESGESSVLSAEEDSRLKKLFSSYAGLPDFTAVRFRKASSALFSYLASSQDSELASAVAAAMGWQSEEEKHELIRKYSQQSASYREYWLALAREVLTCEGFDTYRFGSVRPDRNGTYLYDGEKAVCYIEVSRSGDENRSALISLTLLGNPEAIEDEEGNRAFEWCCFFDDELSSSADARILGGKLRAIDPFGPGSMLHRRYDIVYDSVDASTLAVVVVNLVKMLESYPPEGR